MLKRLATVAVILATQIASSSSGGRTKQDNNSGHQITLAAMSVCDPISSKRQQTTTYEVAHDDAEHRVKLTDIPPISIVKASKDWLDHIFDWGPWVFNLLLVIVGAVGGGFAWRTLRAINRQADLMEGQAQDARESAATAIAIAKESADAAKKSAEAAKISADIAAGVSIPTLAVHEFGTGDVGAADVRAFLQSPKIRMSIKNYGQTPAFLKWWTLCFSCEPLPDDPIYDGPADGMILDKIVVESSAIFTLPDLFYPNRQIFSEEDVEAIIQRKKILHAYGYICYGDIFGNPLRRLKFCETVLNIFGGESICDWWEGFAPPAYAGVEHFPIVERFSMNEQTQQKPEEAD